MSGQKYRRERKIIKECSYIIIAVFIKVAEALLKQCLLRGLLGSCIWQLIYFKNK